MVLLRGDHTASLMSRWHLIARTSREQSTTKHTSIIGLEHRLISAASDQLLLPTAMSCLALHERAP